VPAGDPETEESGMPSTKLSNTPFWNRITARCGTPSSKTVADVSEPTMSVLGARYHSRIFVAVEALEPMKKI
jgi:hypothetical protein